MTLPIKKRINTELFIDRKKGFSYKREIIIADLLGEGKAETAGKQGQPVWNDLHYMEGKTNLQQPV